MVRSLTNLRRALLAFTVVGSLGFGATQAFATPEVAARAPACQVTGWPYLAPIGACPECPDRAYCDGLTERCSCLTLPPIDP